MYVAGQKCAVKQDEFARTMPQHLENSPLHNLALQPKEEFSRILVAVVQRQSFGAFGLGWAKKLGELDEIDVTIAATIEVAAEASADACRHEAEARKPHRPQAGRWDRPPPPRRSDS